MEFSKQVAMKKGEGKGIMVSAWFTSECILEISEEGLFTLKFGGNSGYYDYEKFEVHF